MEESTVQDYLKSYVEARTPESPDDGVLLRNGHQSERIISSEDVEAEVFEWILSHLDAREWPLALSTLLAKTVSQKVSTTQKDSLEWTNLQVDAQETLQGLCSLWLEQPHLVPPMLPPLPFPISTSAMRNGRRKMEDRHITLPYFNYVVGLQDGPEHSYYAVFDGHAGSEAAAYATAHLHHNIAQHPEFLTDPVLAIREGFAVTERNFLKSSSKEGIKSGCTAVCCLVREERLYVGWLGDSQAVLAREGSPIALVEPHKPDREDERQRILELGGAVIMMGTWRVNGALAVSRALGDAEHKPYVSSDPDVITLDLDGTEDFLILGCDGLWDQLTADDVTQHIYKCVSAAPEDSQYIARSLVHSACEYGSTDNITTIVVFLKDPKELGSHFSTDTDICPTGSISKHITASELPSVDDTVQELTSTTPNGLSSPKGYSEHFQLSDRLVDYTVQDPTEQTESDIKLHQLPLNQNDLCPLGGTLEHLAPAMSTTPLVEDFTAEKDDDSELRQVASEVVSSTVEDALNRVNNLEQYLEENGEMQTAQDIVEQVHQLHSEQLTGFQDEFCSAVPVAPEENVEGGIENAGFGENPFEEYGVVQQGINYTGEMVKEDLDQAFSTNPFGPPGVPDTVPNERTVLPQTEDVTTWPLAQDVPERGSGHSDPPPVDSRDSSYLLPTELAAPKFDEFSAERANYEEPFGFVDQRTEPYTTETQHEDYEATLLKPHDDFLQPVEHPVESSQPDVEHNIPQSFLSAKQPADFESYTAEDVHPQQTFSALPGNLEDLPASLVDSLPHEEQLTSLPEDVSIDLSAAPQSIHECAKNQVTGLEPHENTPVFDTASAEDSAVAGFQDDVEVDVTESLSPAVSTDSVVEKKEQQESAVIFCELKEHFVATMPKSEGSTDTTELPLQEVFEHSVPGSAHQESHHYLPEFPEMSVPVEVGAPVEDSPNMLSHGLVDDLQEISQHSSGSSERFQENLQDVPPASLVKTDLIPAATLPDLVMPESLHVAVQPVDTKFESPELAEESVQHEPKDIEAPVMQPAVQETLELLQQPSDTAGEAVEPLKEPVAPVDLGAIPECVPEAEGVTEDSDSEKDGGWKFVKPAVAATAMGVTAAAVTATAVAASACEDVSLPPVVTPSEAEAGPTKVQKQVLPSSKPLATKGSPGTLKMKPAAGKVAARPPTKKPDTTKAAARPASTTTRPASAATKKPADIATSPKTSSATTQRKPLSASSRPSTTQSKVSDKPPAKPKPAASATLPSRPKAPPSVASTAPSNAKKPLSSTRTATLKTTTKTTTAPSKTAPTTTVRQTLSATTTRTTTSRPPALATKKPLEATGTTKPLTRTTASAKLDKDSTNQQLSTRKNIDSSAANRVASARVAASAASQRAAASKTLKQNSAKTTASKPSAAKQATTESAATAIKPKKAIAQQNGVCEEKGALEQQQNKKGDSAEAPVSNGTTDQVKEAEEPVRPDGGLIQQV
ncbi:uncharacterized protein LOC135370036 [Ornithodoros turicata]|uniref:uncharacterized protein LOC135370036 n=1 Tax=Ornithodoros turicata TaxID=34597 RepID=UPI00313A491A